MCRSRRELSNEYLLAKFGFDTGENEPCQVCRIPLRTSHPAQVSELRGLFRRSDAAYQIRVAQYNILAGYLGNNMEPWFLYGVDMPPERREAISKLHAERGPDGAYKNVGWPNYVRGVLSAEEQAAVERVHEQYLFLLFEKLSEVRMLTTFYLAKNDHRWVTFLFLKTYFLPGRRCTQSLSRISCRGSCLKTRRSSCGLLGWLGSR